MSMPNYEAEVRQFIADRFLFGDDKKLGDNISLLESGIVDSTGILEIVAHLEGRFGVKVDNDEMIPENLDTIASIGAFVKRKIS
jgi:acyl carrier protein